MTKFYKNLSPADPKLLQVVADGGTAVTGVVTQPATVVTTVPAMVDPPMMMPTILPIIFAVAVIKALMLGPSLVILRQTEINVIICFREDEG